MMQKNELIQFYIIYLLSYSILILLIIIGVPVKKDDNINIKLFLTLETMGIEALKTLNGKKVQFDEREEDLFEEASDNAESEESIDIDNI